MNAPACLRGHQVAVVPREGSLDELVRAYRDAPETFRRQFGRPVDDLDTVLEIAQAARAAGFSSYFDVRLLADDRVIGHLRADWSLHEEGLVCLHGGSPLDDPHSPGHRRRSHDRARREAWHLMVRAALATPGVARVGTATSASNRAAQAFIAASGFRRIRMLHLPEGREPQVHYRLVRDWLPQAEAQAIDATPGLQAFRPRAFNGPSHPMATPDLNEAVPTPAGWYRLGETDATRWIEASSLAFLQHLADAPPAQATREDLVQTLFFEAAHGTHFFGHPAPDRADPGQALIAVKPLPGRPGWWVMRGGPLQAPHAPESLQPWLDACFARAALRRVEAQVAADNPLGLDWWRGCSLSEEGITEIDRQGRALAYTLARVAA